MMNELQQLSSLLRESPDFWESDNCGSWRMSMVGGIRVEVLGQTPSFSWRATWANGSATDSESTFASVSDAKADLRKCLTERRRELAAVEASPAGFM